MGWISRPSSPESHLSAAIGRFSSQSAPMPPMTARAFTYTPQSASWCVVSRNAVCVNRKHQRLNNSDKYFRINPLFTESQPLLVHVVNYPAESPYFVPKMKEDIGFVWNSVCFVVRLANFSAFMTGFLCSVLECCVWISSLDILCCVFI